MNSNEKKKDSKSAKINVNVDDPLRVNIE